MLTCYLQGGLGNQLFQIFTTLEYALTHKKTFAFTKAVHLDSKRSTYWHSFLLPLSKFTKDINYRNLNAFILKEKEFAYNELPNINANNIVLNGYFQSHKYFQHQYKNIIRLIRLEEQREMVKLKYTSKYQFNLNTNTVSIHFRRGDYKQLQYHYQLMGYEYYYKALTHITSTQKKDTTRVLVFCEKDDLNDVLPILDKLRQHFPTLTFQIIDFTIPDWEQMLLMSLCQDNIIANSSFSWWGAYFNANPDKIVCYPINWFGTALKHYNIKDLCPSSWTYF